MGIGYEQQPQQQLQGATHPSQFVADTGQARQIRADGIQFIEPCIEIIGSEQGAIGTAQGFEVVLQIVQTPKRAAEHGETPVKRCVLRYPNANLGGRSRAGWRTGTQETGVPEGTHARPAH
ncbi:hypothetical protein TUM18999_27360 [Pseudomonas tohonis]|uniref:Uncharacterized protein n=1 Tax=Pseudomonas tohonis TaxID=2725477 RepID=A0A6J4E572_9PSED|nr:hypothetical protein TUM18999_27360 [Pseudomonas tohonis]GJN52096.1 hypothetical protein TUM20286_18480 [Pseudomonas tohonis]